MLRSVHESIMDVTVCESGPRDLAASPAAGSYRNLTLRSLILSLVLGFVVGCSGGGGGSGGIAAPSGLSYPDPQSFNTTSPVTIAPTVTGLVTSYTVNPSLPVGLTLNSATGAITGTPTTPVAQAIYMITASNAAGSTAFALHLTVNLAPPSGLSYPSPQSLSTTAEVDLTPTVTGVVTTYSVTPALPAWLTLNGATGAITGRSSMAVAQTTYTITASNAAGSTTFGLTLTVVRPPLVISSGAPPNGKVGVNYSPPDYREPPGRPPIDFTFSATGGVGGPAYSWSAESLPPGLTVTPNGSLIGTPTSSGNLRCRRHGDRLGISRCSSACELHDRHRTQVYPHDAGASGGYDQSVLQFWLYCGARTWIPAIYLEPNRRAAARLGLRRRRNAFRDADRTRVVPHHGYGRRRNWRKYATARFHDSGGATWIHGDRQYRGGALRWSHGNAAERREGSHRRRKWNGHCRTV